jgi:hypothetical protein
LIRLSSVIDSLNHKKTFHPEGADYYIDEEKHINVCLRLFGGSYFEVV